MRDWALLGTVLGLLSLATFSGQWLKHQSSLGLDTKTIDAFNSRIQAWWFFSIVLGISFFHPILTVVLFGMLAFWVLREYITLTPTTMGDHRALFWVFFFFTPTQFVLVAFDMYSLYSVLIPVYAFLFIAARALLFLGIIEDFWNELRKSNLGFLCAFIASVLSQLCCT